MFNKGKQRYYKLLQKERFDTLKMLNICKGLVINYLY
jgi:hypothetical protein